MFRRLTVPQLVADSVIGVLWLLFGLLPQLGDSSRPLLPVVLVLLSCALVLRRLSPGLSLSVAWAGALLQVLLGAGPVPFDAAIFGVLYATGSYGGRVVRWAGLASAPAGAAVIAVLQFVQSAGELREPTTFLGIELPAAAFAALTSFIGFLVAFLLAWTLGSLTRIWRLSREARAGELQAQREVVVQQERNQIAREVHDVVAHSLAVVIAQADGARYSPAPEAKDAALVTIAATARESLGDVRLLLERLRHAEGPVPQPTLADLDALIEQVRTSGLEVRVARTGTEHPLPAGRALAVYRIVQEALTNALRHGDLGAGVDLRLHWGGDELTVEVRNAAASAPGAEGHGLPGMRERAALSGGALRAGAVDGAWTVTATVPVGTP